MLVWRVVRVARWQAEEEDKRTSVTSPSSCLLTSLADQLSRARREGTLPSAAQGLRDRPGLQGDPRRQTRLGAGGQFLHEGRHRRGQGGRSAAVGRGAASGETVQRGGRLDQRRARPLPGAAAREAPPPRLTIVRERR